MPNHQAADLLKVGKDDRREKPMFLNIDPVQ
jgi:hypothetical protein